MDAPRRLIYRKSENREEEPQEPSPEELAHGEAIAEQKLEQILASDFQEFSCRFVNIEEYRHILETGELKGEVLTYHKTQELSFSGFLHRNIQKSTNWYDRPISSTKWRRGEQAIMIAHGFLRGLQRIWVENRGKNRDERLEIFRSALTDFIRQVPKIFFTFKTMGMGDENPVSDKQIPEELISAFDYDDSEEILKKIDFFPPAKAREIAMDRSFELWEGLMYRPISRKDVLGRLSHMMQEGSIPALPQPQQDILTDFIHSRYLESFFGKERIQVLRNLKNEDYLKQKGALRDAAIALSHMFDVNAGVKQRQYHIALIFDNATFGFSKPTFWWDSFKDALLRKRIREPGKEFSRSEKASGLLAAISLMPLRDFQQEMARLDAQAGDFAHPIFDYRGKLRWPEENRPNESA